MVLLERIRTVQKCHARTLRALSGMLFVAAAFLAAPAAGLAPLEDPSDSAPALSTLSSFMVGVLNPAANVVWKGGSAEKLTPDDWDHIKQAAAALNRSITPLSLGGWTEAERQRAKSPVWQEWSQRFAGAVRVAERAANEHDQGALANAGDMLTQICESCHAATIGTVH